MELVKIHTDPQEELINSPGGILLVDAGAGTGKTWTIIERYRKLVESGVMPKDILLITFTKNAASQMREEVIKKVSGTIGFLELLEAPVLTFHAYCTKLLKNFGTNSPSYLGLTEVLPSNFSILEDRYLEIEIFRRFCLNFVKKNRIKYKSVIESLDPDYEIVLNVIKKLCSVGIFPTKEGWSSKNQDKLKGDFERFSEMFDSINVKKFHKTRAGIEKQNELYKRFNELCKTKLYLLYKRENVLIENVINPEIKEELFYDERQDELLDFIGDIYISYLRHLLEKNMLNYEFVIMLAYLVLHNNRSLREKLQFDHVMIDEFQDTDEIQFKLIMLLCRSMDNEANLSVVGDWKQGIYGFRNTTIENITRFEEKLSVYKRDLNKDDKRIRYDTSNIKKIVFENNYRSSELILKFSKSTLLVKGNEDEEVDEEAININFKEILKPQREYGDLTEIKFYQGENKNQELEMILRKISELVNENEKYLIINYNKLTGELSEKRPVRYSDICVLSRTKKFGLELLKEAVRYGIPMNYGGGIELFSTQPGVLVLAWLRLILNEKDIYGWLPVLDKEGYNFTETKYLLGKIMMTKEEQLKLFNDIPENLTDFLKYLATKKENTLYVIEAILSRYSFSDEFANKIITVINSWLSADIISIHDLVQIIENCKTTEFEIEINKSVNSVLVQTIHAAKGLEYPVVILSNCNAMIFPDSTGDRSRIIYHPAIGLRAKQMFTSNGKYHYKFDNWKTNLLTCVVKKSDYDEERRLLYVASTRAKQYLYFTAHNASCFFTGLAEISSNEIIKDFNYGIKPVISSDKSEQVDIIIEGITEPSKKYVSPHLLMSEMTLKEAHSQEDSKNFSVKSNRESMNYGALIHNIAHKIASNIEVESDYEEVKRIRKFISDLNACELKSEVDFLFPKEDEVIRGTIDLVAFFEDRIEVIDYKTDINKKFLDMYKVQIEVYKDVVGNIHPGKNIIGKIYFVKLDDVVEM